MAQPRARMTPAEYLAFERAAETKHEYYDGEIFAFAGASREHNLVSGNLFAELHLRLRGKPCETYSSDMRVKVEASGLYTYPDIVAVCGEPRFEDEVFDTLLNPTFLVEVLSPSTADYDQGAKFGHYREIPALREVLFVAQDEVHVMRYVRRDDDTWILSETRDLEATLELTSLGVELAVAETYARVPLEAD